MSFLIIDRERYALQLGETVLGGDGDELLASSSLASLAPFAVVRCDLSEGASIRALPSASGVTLGGKPLGTEPCVLHHGDRIAVGHQQILYGEARAVGSTTHIGGMTNDEVALLAGLYR